MLCVVIYIPNAKAINGHHDIFTIHIQNIRIYTKHHKTILVFIRLLLYCTLVSQNFAEERHHSTVHTQQDVVLMPGYQMVQVQTAENLEKLGKHWNYLELVTTCHNSHDMSMIHMNSGCVDCVVLPFSGKSHKISADSDSDAKTASFRRSVMRIRGFEGLSWLKGLSAVSIYRI